MDNNNLTKKKRKKEIKFHSYEKNFVWIFNSSTNPISIHVSDNIPFYFSYPFPARLRIRVSFLSRHFCFSIMYSYKSVVQIAPICELNWIKLNLVFVFKKKKTRQIYLRTCNTPKTIYYIVCDRIVSPGFRTNFAHDVSRIRKETRDVSRLYALSVSLSRNARDITFSKAKSRSQKFPIMHDIYTRETISWLRKRIRRTVGIEGMNLEGESSVEPRRKLFFSRNVLKEGCGESSRWTTDRVDLIPRAQSRKMGRAYPTLIQL